MQREVRQAGWAYAHLTNDLDRREYLAIRDALLHRLPSFPISTDPAQTNRMLLAVLDDNPQIFWFEGAWVLSHLQGRPAVRPRYTCDPSTMPHAIQALRNATGAITQRACSFDPPNRALYLYDWMRAHVRYGPGTSGGQTAYDALVRGEALCKGIAKGYQLLLLQVGIPSTLMRGSIGGAGRHVWNLVCLHGSCAHVDISLAHRRFDPLFGPDEMHNPRRCFLMSEDDVKRHGVIADEGVDHA